MPTQRNPQESGLTIGDLAERVGMTVRNLREWRTLGLLPPAELRGRVGMPVRTLRDCRALGLLPPAELRGRVGYYDQSVVARVERIKELHEQGFPLELIRRMLEASDGFGDDVMGLASALRGPFREEE